MPKATWLSLFSLVFQEIVALDTVMEETEIPEITGGAVSANTADCVVTERVDDWTEVLGVMAASVAETAYEYVTPAVSPLSV
jgi:hypothetical protein